MSSDPFQFGQRPFIVDVAGVESRCRLEEQHHRLLVGNGSMLDAAGNDQEFAFLQPHLAVAKLHAEPSLHACAGDYHRAYHTIFAFLGSVSWTFAVYESLILDGLAAVNGLLQRCGLRPLHDLPESLRNENVKHW